MPRYAAFLRGVMPMNAKMPELRAAFESAGFNDVRTIASSGNVVFATRSASIPAIERKAEAAMQASLGRTFLTIVRSIETLKSLLDTDPYNGGTLGAGTKRVVTFLRTPMRTVPPLPITRGPTRIVAATPTEAFTLYAPNPDGPDFMRLIEQTFGKEQTTRTWEMLVKVAR